jgi:hypothetical protein
MVPLVRSKTQSAQPAAVRVKVPLLPVTLPFGVSAASVPESDVNDDAAVEKVIGAVLAAT